MATAVVTGANKGIGLELARQLSQRGDEVIATVRSVSNDLAALDVEVHEDVDVRDDGSVERFATALARRKIDVLINNAGILTKEPLEDLDWDRMRAEFEVNALGPLRVTKWLLPNLVEGSKVAIVSSRVGSLTDNSSGSNYGYRMSKAAVNMAGVNLSIDLKDKGITVILLHPGFVRTNLTGWRGEIGPEESARGLIARIDEADMSQTGTFRHANGTRLPW